MLRSTFLQFIAFNLATQAINAGTNNRIILSEIDRINQKVDELIFSIAQLDIELGTKLRNNSFAIGVSFAIFFWFNAVMLFFKLCLTPKDTALCFYCSHNP